MAITSNDVCDWMTINAPADAYALVFYFLKIKSDFILFNILFTININFVILCKTSMTLISKIVIAKAICDMFSTKKTF